MCPARRLSDPHIPQQKHSCVLWRQHILWKISYRKIRKYQLFDIVGDLLAIWIVNVWKRYAQKLGNIMLLHFELITLRCGYGRTLTPFISMILGLSDVSLTTQNQLCLSLETPGHFNKSKTIPIHCFENMNIWNCWNCVSNTSRFFGLYISKVRNLETLKIWIFAILKLCTFEIMKL